MKTYLEVIAVLFFMCSVVLSEIKEFTFDNAEDLKKIESTGDVVVDSSQKHAGVSSLKLESGSTVVLKLRETDGTGKVIFWVYEDCKSSEKPKKSGVGAMWGLQQADGKILSAGAIYAPYLSGNKTYSIGSYTAEKNEKPWQKVQYLGIKRKQGWHQWVFDFNPEAGLSISFDGKDINANRELFNWNKSQFNGFVSVVFFGDKTDAGQVLWVDDLSVTLGSVATVRTKWPPPPPVVPEDLTVVPPPADWSSAPYAKWENGPGKSDDFFPIAVWLQDTKLAERYKAAGINMYLGLWKGPTKEQVDDLKAAGMPVMCEQNEYALQNLDDPIFVGWTHGDEPDNARKFSTYWNGDKEKIKEGWPEIYDKCGLATKDYKGYGPSVPPKWIIRDYKKLKKNDPTRPIYVGLGQGVSWNKWKGRGERSGHLEDYHEYIKGSDIVAFDIYPAAENNLQIKNALWFVPQGVNRLRKWGNDKKTVWVHIETGIISKPPSGPTPQQTKAEVWMAIIHGARGIDYFVHQFKPKFNSHALLDNPEMLAMVTSINKQITSLASVLNSKTVENAVTVKSSNSKTPVNVMVKYKDGATYLFAVAMYNEDTKATFKIAGIKGTVNAEVLGENRTIVVKDGRFTDSFKADGVHLYRIK